MKELKPIDYKPIINTHYPIKERPPTKRWVIAQARSEKQQVIQNKCTEVAYHRIIDAVKQLHLKPGDTYYDRDLKQDRAEGLFGMHAFMCSSFYCILYCELLYKYVVEYAFDNCTFEQEISIMLRQYPLDKQATERDLKPNYKGFYSNVLALQDQRFIHSL